MGFKLDNSDSVIAGDVSDMLGTLRLIAEPLLDHLGLSIDKIGKQNLSELELSLITLRSAIQKPESFGIINLQFTGPKSVIVAQGNKQGHMQINVLPVLLEREQLILKRIRDLDELHRLHDLDNVVDLVKDNAVRAVMAERLRTLREKAARYDREIEARRPKLFIGSSSEGLPIAEAIQLNLDHSSETTLWSQGVFGLSEGTLEALVRAVAVFDFAVLVLTPDDLVAKRDNIGQQARDNVLFELGLFMGKLGRDRTFIVHERKIALDLPSDLAGITPATFRRRADNNIQAALGPVCTQLKAAMSAANSQRS